MGFDNRKRDDHGHVIGNNETDGQPCQHQSGKSSKSENKQEDKLTPRQAERFDKKSELVKKYMDMGYKNDEAILHAERDMVEQFDADYDEEFNDIEDSEEKEINEKLKSQDVLYTDIEMEGMFEDDPELLEEFKKAGFVERDGKLYIPKGSEVKKVTDGLYSLNGYDFEANEWPEDDEPQEQSKAESFKDKIDRYNRMVGLESQMHSKIDNARKNGQSPQQVLDSVAYDMDIQPGTEEYDRLKTLVMYDTRLNKDTGSYEYNKYNSGSNKQVTGDERKKLQDLSDAFNRAGLENELKDTWEDYGARMGMTNLIHNNTQVLNPREWIDYMNGNASAEDIIQRIKNSPYKSVFKWKEPQNDRQTIIDYYKEKGKDINPELLDKELKSAVHKDFKEGEQVFDTSYGGKGTPGKIVRKLSMKENLDRAGLNNPLAGDYYEIETEFLGIPSRRIVWAGRLNKGE